MKIGYFGLGLAIMGVTIATPARAGTSADFASCDGLNKPKRKEDGMRGEASMPSYRMSHPSSVIEACTRVLNGDDLRPEQALRRAHLLRARAAAYLRSKQYDPALADLDAAEVAIADYRPEFFFDRSMGVSLDLLRAIALFDSGRGDEAARMAEEAALKRPYALQVQRVATMIRDSNLDPHGSRRELWAMLQQIDPGTRQLAERAIAQRDEASFEELVAQAADAPPEFLPVPRIEAVAGTDLTGPANSWARPYVDALDLAYAHAALGQPEPATRWLAEVRESVEAARIPEDGESATSLRPIFVGFVDDRLLKARETLAEARIALAEGRPQDVPTLLAGARYRSNRITRELYDSYEAARAQGNGELPPLAELTPAPERATPELALLADNLLLRPESERKLIDYEKSRPNILGALVGGALTFGTSLLGGIERTAGFRSSENADGTVKVEYNGNTNSGPVVEEMTLLRAAELARESGHSHFLITDRNDYQRYLTQLVSGVVKSRTLTGYKTELTVRYLDDPAEDAHAIEALSIIDALGPIYYGDS